MVVTLKSGVQIKQTVENYTVSRASVFGELRELKWTFGDERDADIMWLDMAQVAAIHTEYEPGAPASAASTA